MRPVLYSFRRCPYAMRARLAIRYSKIDVELREVDLNEIPAALAEISADKTVPVILEPDGNVIEESWDIVKWAVEQNDPDNWSGDNNCFRSDAEMMVETNDYSFKTDLDHYKYAERYPEYPMEHYRSEGEEFLSELEERLITSNYLSSDTVSISDIAVFPFVRQFAHVDKDWFNGAPYPRLQIWLAEFLESDLFNSVMEKYPCGERVMSLSVFNIETTDDPRKLTQAVIQIIDCLNMYQAELARVLGVQCSDIGELSSAKRCLQPETEEWRRALLFVRLYQMLFAEFDGDGVAINHWMRSEHSVLKRTPHLLIVDDERLEDVVEFLETAHET